MAAELKPDVVTCDLNMPNMDGVAFVRAQMARQPIPIVIISIAAASGEQVLAALDAGAVDFVQKPTALATERLMDIADELVEKVKAAAAAPRRTVTGQAKPCRRRCRSRSAGPPPSVDIVVHGHLHRRAAGAEGRDSAAARRTFRCRSRWCCTCRSGTPSCTPRSSNEMSALTVVEAGEGQVVGRGRCSSRRPAAI